MKKIFAFLMCILMLTGFAAACAQDDKNKAQNDNSNITQYDPENQNSKDIILGNQDSGYLIDDQDNLGSGLENNIGLENNGGENLDNGQDSTQGAAVHALSGYEVQALTVLNIRSGPSTSDAVIGQAQNLDTISHIETQGSWHKVLYKDKVAYISANNSYTRLIDAKKNKAIIDNIINEGMKVLGTPYEFGSARILLYNGNYNKSFTGKTFDCSAFVQYAYYVGAGIKLQGDSRSQSKYGILVPHDKLQRGDLIFMWSSSRQYNTGIEQIGHVAMYLGDNKILHTWGTGGVRVQEYTTGWQNRFILARRMV